MCFSSRFFSATRKIQRPTREERRNLFISSNRGRLPPGPSRSTDHKAPSCSNSGHWSKFQLIQRLQAGDTFIRSRFFHNSHLVLTCVSGFLVLHYMYCTYCTLSWCLESSRRLGACNWILSCYSCWPLLPMFRKESGLTGYSHASRMPRGQQRCEEGPGKVKSGTTLCPPTATN